MKTYLNPLIRIHTKLYSWTQKCLPSKIAWLQWGTCIISLKMTVIKNVLAVLNMDSKNDLDLTVMDSSTHPSTKFRGNGFSSFHVTMVTIKEAALKS